MAQLKPLPLTVSCFSKIQIGFTFLVPAYPGSSGKRAIRRVCVCVIYCSRKPGSARNVKQQFFDSRRRKLERVLQSLFKLYKLMDLQTLNTQLHREAEKKEPIFFCISLNT